MPSSVFGNVYYNDNNSSENLDQVSPGFSPKNGMGYGGDGDDRRPSIASATTVSSTGSNPSVGGRFHKKLEGFFGNEYDTSRQGSETSSIQGSLPSFAPGAGGGGQRNRASSTNQSQMRSDPPSPSSSRPRTPTPQQPPSADVTPWAFQDSKVRWRSLGRYFLAMLTCAAGCSRLVLSRPKQRPGT